MRSVDATLAFVSRSSHRESVIAFDYSISISDDSLKSYGVKEFHETMKKQHENERLKFSIDEGTTASFLGQRGLKMLGQWDNEEIERMFLLDGNGLSPGRITGNFRFVLAAPNMTHD